MLANQKDQPLPKTLIELGDVRVAYTDQGRGRPILLVHGIPTSSYLWRNVIRELDDEFRLIAPDLMGLGDTETPLDHRYDMEAQAEKLLELADGLGLTTFALVCHDQGGAAAQWLAVHNPERIDRFILTNCVGYDNWPVPPSYVLLVCDVDRIGSFTGQGTGTPPTDLNYSMVSGSEPGLTTRVLMPLRSSERLKPRSDWLATSTTGSERERAAAMASRVTGQASASTKTVIMLQLYWGTVRSVRSPQA